MLYRFQIELSDIDRGVYQSLDFRVVQHPSENAAYLLTRVFAYVLSFEEGIEFSAVGLGDPEAPALTVKNASGAILLWIEIGNPSAKKLHKATKQAKQVRVFTYKSAKVLLEELQANEIHKAESIEIFALDSKVLERLEKNLAKNNRWSILHQQGNVDVNTGSEDFVFELKEFNLQKS